MSLKKTIHKIRQKPQHVRERILLVTLAVAAPLLFTIWFATFQFNKPSGSSAFLGEIKGTVSNSFNNPLYKETFGTPSLTSPGTGTPAPASGQNQTDPLAPAQ